MDKNSMNPLYFGKKGKSLFARDLREGPRDGDRDGHRTGPRSQISKRKISESGPASQYPFRELWLGVSRSWRVTAGSRRSSLVFRSPAGSEVSEGARGPEVTEQREPRIRRRSGQGLREGTGRAAPAGLFGTRVGGRGPTLCTPS